jgi:uncharacterized protein (DUF427 family)
VPYYPQYYVPVKDVRTQHLVDENHPRRLQFGTSASHALHVNGVTVAGAVRVFGDDAVPGLEGTARFAWDAVEWFEEDERIVGGHPRNPYARVDALRSHRHVRVEVDGVVLADTHAPVLLFETGLPTRYYLPEEDVRLDLLTPSANRSHCPYKGDAERYWDFEGHRNGSGIAWSYPDPYPAVGRIQDRIAFYNELVDVTVDGVAQPRPVSLFSARANRPTT